MNLPLDAPAPSTPTSHEQSKVSEVLEGSLPDLEAKLRDQIKKWQSKLLDLSNRNPLINCSFNPSRGVVELLTPNSETIWRKLAAEGSAGSNSMRFAWRRDLVPPPKEYLEQEKVAARDGALEKKVKEWNPPLEECRKSRKLKDTDILTPLGDRLLERRLRTLNGHANLSLSEQGVHCLFMAFGFLRWFESVDSEVEHLSPLLLVPMSLSRSSADAPWELVEAEDDAIDNLSLRQRLKDGFGMVLPPLPDIDELEEAGARLSFLDAVRQAIAQNERWEVQDRCALGRFAFPKVAMWQDLGDHTDSVLSNVLCRSIGGDENVPPRQAFGLSSPLPDPATLDDVIAPGEIKTILDSDSSQLEAILAARRGVSFVLDGPPGTGKSQTIANIIADALSEGRRVLFVSEKVSALEVVKRRLDDRGLGDFCLECHSSKANRKTVLDELNYCLNLQAEIYNDAAPKLEESKQKRALLNDYVRSIHRRRPPLGLSPYELSAHIARSHRLGHASKSRCSLPNIDDKDRSHFEAWLQLVDRANESASVILEYEHHPWRGCLLTSRSLTLADDLQHHFGVLSNSFELASDALSPLIERALLETATLRSLDGVLDSLREALQAPEIPADWFHAPQQIAAAIIHLNKIERALTELREGLPEFVDGVEADFPETLPDTGSREHESLEQRFQEPVPVRVREQYLFLQQPTEELRGLTQLINQAAGVNSSMTCSSDRLAARMASRSRGL